MKTKLSKLMKDPAFYDYWMRGFLQIEIKNDGPTITSTEAGNKFTERCDKNRIYRFWEEARENVRMLFIRITGRARRASRLLRRLGL